jgi:hypothetical protein
MFRNFLLKKMMKKQLQGVPVAEQEKLIKAIESNPEFFNKISEEVKKRTDKGEDQMTATMEVMKSHQAELQKIFGEQQ